MKRYFLITSLLIAFFCNIAKGQCPPNAYAYASVYPQCPLGCGVLLKDWPEGVIVNIYGGDPLQIITSVSIPGAYGGPSTGSAFTCVPCNVPLVYASAVPGATSGCVITTLGVVPITLSNFSVLPNANFTQTIKWETANENMGDQYTVQKSFDGSNFISIGYIAGGGGFNKNYSFTDQVTQPEDVSYRLKITESAGNISYSKIINVKGKPIKGIVLYPNPTENGFKINIAEQLLPATIHLINTQGQTIYNTKTNSPVLDFTNKLQAGIYAVRVFGKNSKVIIQTLIIK